MNLQHLLRSTTVWRGILGFAGAVAVLAWPELFGDLLVWLIGLGAMAVGVMELVIWVGEKPRSAWDLMRALALILGGAFVLIAPTEPVDLVRAGVAAILAVRAVGSLLAAYRQWRKNRKDPFWSIIKSTLSLVLAVALLLVPGALLSFVVAAVAAVWILSAVLVVMNDVLTDRAEAAPSDLAGLVADRDMDPETRELVTGALFAGLDSWDGSVRFVTLMAFSTTIATFGIQADSTAVVIGAMLIAPLMAPIMALSAGILMGWVDKALMALRRAWFGVGIAILTSFVMSFISPDFIDIASNSQVLSRTSPTILDLLIALAAGGAGGYALSHPQVSDSLPGVAIAVALVPPLAVVGVSLQAGEIGFAGGAFLLFLANFVGIVISAGLVFIVTGYSPWSRFSETGETGRRSSGLVLVSLALIALPLMIIGRDIIEEINDAGAARSAVTSWLDGAEDVSVSVVEVDGNDVRVDIVAGQETPPPEDLAEALAQDLERRINLELNITPQFTEEVSAG